MYVYIKGEGWIPVESERKWCVIFRGSRFPWENAVDKHHTYDTYEEALEDYNTDIEKYVKEYGHDWEYKIIPAEDEQLWCKYDE